MMDVIDVLVKQSDEKIVQLKDYLAEGRAENVHLTLYTNSDIQVVQSGSICFRQK